MILLLSEILLFPPASLVATLRAMRDLPLLASTPARMQWRWPQACVLISWRLTEGEKNLVGVVAGGGKVAGKRPLGFGMDMYTAVFKQENI